MKTGKLGIKAAVAVALASLAGVSHAAIATFGPDDIRNASGESSEAGLTLKWSAVGGGFGVKEVPGAGWGVGINGSTGRTVSGEIDDGEAIEAEIKGSGAFIVNEIALGLLFDGSEFNDVQEVARITASIVGGEPIIATLTNLWTADPSAVPVWSFGGGSSVQLISPSTAAGGGAWRILNPFGTNLVTKLVFDTVDGVPSNDPNSGCVAEGGNVCGDQSDYNILSLKATAVPEPATLSLLGLGLLGAGAAARRRRAT